MSNAQSTTAAAGEDGLGTAPQPRDWDPARFAHPRSEDRPGMRWWWQSAVPAAELVRELHAIADAGFSEVEIAFGKDFWATDAQRLALAAVLEAAEARQVGVAMTLGAEWPVRTPNTTTGTKHAAQELQYGVLFVNGPDAGPFPVPPPFDDESFDRPARLSAVTAARVLQRNERPSIVSTGMPFGPQLRIVPPDASTILDEESLVDLTEMTTDGQVRWQAAEGAWAIFAFWMRDTAQGATSFLDADAARAATQYLDEFQIGAENDARLRRVGTDLFEDSLELNADSMFWSPTIVARFIERHGYDPTRYLPVLFAHGMCRYWVPNDEPVPDFALPSGVDGRIRHDYYQLLTDLYIDDHLLLLQEWAAGRGLRHKAQVAYGQNLEPIRSNRRFVQHGGRAEGESLNSGDRAPVRREHPNWKFAVDWQRSIVAGAHQGGASRISTELGAQMGAAFALSLGDLRQMLDKEWAVGITRPFVHGFGSQDADAVWPTQTRFWDYVADTWNDMHYPEWPNWKPLTDYWARGTIVLETGTPRTDVAIYRDGFLTTAARGIGDADFTAPDCLADTEALERAGYSIQFIDPDGLSEPSEAEVLFPDGPSYRAVIIDDERSVPVRSAEALAKAAARGVRVVIVGHTPAADSGFAAPDGAERVVAAFASLLKQPTVALVHRMDEVPQALRNLGVVPRVSYLGPPLLTQWREAGEDRLVLVYNPTPDRVAVDLRLEGNGQVCELRPDTGAVIDIAHEADGDSTVVPVQLAPLGLLFLHFTHSGEFRIPLAEAATVVAVPITDWELSVTCVGPYGDREVHLPGQGPADWQTVDELRHASGVGVYRAHLRIPAGQAASAELCLGQLAGSAIVRIGNETFGPVFVSDAALDLGDSLRPGQEMVIEIEVRTPLRNAVVGSGRLGGSRALTVPHGLIGPVSVVVRS